MFRRFEKSSFIKTVLFVLIAVSLSACGGGGSTADSPVASNTASTEALTTNDSVTDDIQLAGSVGDGPVTGATVEVWNSRGRLIGTMKSDKQASFKGRIRVNRSNYPLLLKARGGIDLVSGSAPDFQMTSVMPDRFTRRVNINPFSALIVRIAQSLPGGINAKNLRVAKQTVTTSLGFGLDTRLIADPVTARITDANVANLTKSSEALGEMVRRTRDVMTEAGRRINGDTVMAAIAADLHDGTLDGKGTAGTDPELTAVAKVVSGQVLVEALANTLKVGGVVATNVIDQSIVTTRPGIGNEDLTQSVRVTAGMLEQTRNALAAAMAMDASAEVRGLDTIISGIDAGAMPADVHNVLPAASSRSLDNAVALVATADESQRAAVNAGEALAGDVTGNEPDVTEPPASSSPEPTPQVPDVTDPPASPSPEPTPQVPVNNAPFISGSPAGTVKAGTSYSFRPTAGDADDDRLSFSITGKPAWASFSTSTGRLSGTPGDSDVGSYRNIVIAVSDGANVTTLPAFSVTVDSAPVQTGSFSLTWTAPVTRADGSPIALSDIGGYRIHYGVVAGNYPATVEVSDGSAQGAKVENIPAGTYHVVMTTYDMNGLESVQSPAIVKTAR
jgi:hypothetical protein